MAFWALVMAALVAAAVAQHVKTSDAWTHRFSKTPAQRFAEIKTLADAATTQSTEHESRRTDAKRAALAELRLRREAAENEARSRTRQGGIEQRCINGIVFRRIPGGWENVPGMKC